WRSFDMASRIRLVKFFVKEAAIELFFSVSATIAIGAQVFALGLSKDSVAVTMDGM
ncbi:hypothetical protein KCU96_g12406, partial [Aureobasidium melanogenum]